MSHILPVSPGYYNLPITGEDELLSAIQYPPYNAPLSRSDMSRAIDYGIAEVSGVVITIFMSPHHHLLALQHAVNKVIDTRQFQKFASFFNWN